MLNPTKTQQQNFTRLQIIGTAIATAFIFGLLLWDYFHGGVPRHHLLDNKDLPAISNWWGGLLLPIVTWILLGRMIKRLQEKRGGFAGRPGSAANPPGLDAKILRLFFIGLIFGITLAVSFTYNVKPFLDNVLYILLILSLLVPIFYSEFILGFILGMTYTFGALLPTAFVLIMACVGFLLFRFVRPLIMKLFRRST